MSSHARAAGALLTLTLAGCGEATRLHHPRAPGEKSFAWLAAGRSPASWAPMGALQCGTLPRPPGWRAVSGDRGSVSFVQISAGGMIVGYLNATPRSGGETLANWARFRIAHNADEGDHQVRATATLTAMAIGAARASCVIDDYSTSRSRYRELACLIDGPRASTVVVGAAPSSDWPRQRPVIERAIAGFLAS